MNKFMRIMAVVVCVLFIVVVPQVEAGKGGHGGGNGGGNSGGNGGPCGVPEIDPGMASSALGLLAGGVLMLTAKRKGKMEDRAAG
jgi:hypothetical protein